MERSRFAVLYRWKVRPEALGDFVAAWRTATEAYVSVGAFGSRLHRGDDGDLYAYAEWPDRKTWELSNSRVSIAPAVAATMRDATLEFEAKPLAIAADLLARAAD